MGRKQRVLAREHWCWQSEAFTLRGCNVALLTFMQCYKREIKQHLQ